MLFRPQQRLQYPNRAAAIGWFGYLFSLTFIYVPWRVVTAAAKVAVAAVDVVAVAVVVAAVAVANTFQAAVTLAKCE